MEAELSSTELGSINIIIQQRKKHFLRSQAYEQASHLLEFFINLKR